MVIERKQKVEEKQIKTTLNFLNKTNKQQLQKQFLGFTELWQGKYKANKVTCNYILF